MNLSDEIIIGCCIVTYNPEKARLFKCLSNVQRQVNCIVVVDNGSIENDFLSKLSNKFNNLKIIFLGKNLGIAKALNEGYKALRKECNMQWILTLDQDTVLPLNFVKNIFSYIIPYDCAVLCGIPIDKRRYQAKYKCEHELLEIDKCIQSGSLYKSVVLEKMNFFEEKLFIDYVDFEYCYRIRKASFKVYQARDVFFDQEFGNLSSSKFKHIWLRLYNYSKIPLFKKLSYKPEVKGKRIYYTVRNRIYCQRKFHLKGNFSFFFSTLFFYAKILFRGRNFFILIKYIFRGTKDGMNFKI